MVLLGSRSRYKGKRGWGWLHPTTLRHKYLKKAADQCEVIAAFWVEEFFTLRGFLL